MLRFTGDTVLSSVEANQSITVTDGSLTISGDVGSRAIITLESNQSNRTNQMNFGGSVVIGNNINIGSAGHKLIVKGKVGSKATLKSTYDNISTGNIGSGAALKSIYGNVSAGDVASGAILKSTYGNVSAGDVGSDAILKSTYGNVSVQSRDSSVTISTTYGKCYVNGRQENRRQNRSTVTSDVHTSPSSSLFFGIPSYGNLNISSTVIAGRVNGQITNSVFITGVEQRSTPSQTQNSRASANTSSSGNTMPAVLQSYINDFKGESFQDAFKRLAVDVNDKYSFLSIFCVISQDVPNIPVSLNGRLYDWNSLKSQIETNGYNDPMTRETFTLKQVIPDRTTRDSLEGILKKEEEMHKSDIATCSSPAFKRWF